MKYMTVVYQAETKEDLKDFYAENIMSLLFAKDEKVSVPYVSAGNTTINEEDK